MHSILTKFIRWGYICMYISIYSDSIQAYIFHKSNYIFLWFIDCNCVKKIVADNICGDVIQMQFHFVSAFFIVHFRQTSCLTNGLCTSSRTGAMMTLSKRNRWKKNHHHHHYHKNIIMCYESKINGWNVNIKHK